MSTSRPKKNDTTPIEEGWEYLVTPGGVSTQWVEVVEVAKGYVRAVGIGSNHADWHIRVGQFDDLVRRIGRNPYYLVTEINLEDIVTEDDSELLAK